MGTENGTGSEKETGTEKGTARNGTKPERERINFIISFRAENIGRYETFLVFCP